MAIEGPLKELGIHDVFQMLDLSRKTGVLNVVSRIRRNHGTVYFDSGSVVYAEIRSNPHRLGEMLVRNGTISQADLTRAVERQRQGDGRRVGEILLETGAVGPQELERHVREQVEEVVFELMSWREGYFSFQDDLPNAFAAGSLRISTAALLMEAARRIDEWSRIEARIPDLGAVPRFHAAEQAGPEGLDLLPQEWEVLSTVDGTATIREIAITLERSEFDVARTILGLASAGVVTLDEPGRDQADSGQAAEEVSGLWQQAEQALEAGAVATALQAAERAQAADPHDARGHELMGRVSIAGRRDAEAEEHLRRALRLEPERVESHRLLGDVLARQGRFAEAVDCWQRWLAAQEAAGHTERIDEVRDAMRAAQTLVALLQGPSA